MSNWCVTGIQEWSGGGQLVNYVYLDGQLVALNEMTGYGGGSPTEATYYVHADRLGTPQAVTDGSKTVQWTQLYQPFGLSQSLSNPGNIVQDLLFPGQVSDSETNRPYNGSRYYNPHTGAYIQTDFDDILQSGTTNTYTYAASNPFSFTDENGGESYPFQSSFPPTGFPQYQTPSTPNTTTVLQQQWNKLTPAQQFRLECNLGGGLACTPLVLTAAEGWGLPLLVGCRAALLAACERACSMYWPNEQSDLPIHVFNDNPQGVPLGK